MGDQIEKMEVEEEIKSGGERFYEIFRSKQYLLPKICPHIIKDAKLIHGDWDSVGSIKQWTYVAGNSETSKETVEAIDEEKKSITFKPLEGTITNYYNNVKSTIQVVTETSSVKWTIQFQKNNHLIPSPTHYLALFSSMIKNVDAYLTAHN